MARLMAKLGLGVSVADFNNDEHVEDRTPTVTAVADDISVSEPEGKLNLGISVDTDLDE
jgi:hypothetical protein